MRADDEFTVAVCAETNCASLDSVLNDGRIELLPLLRLPWFNPSHGDAVDGHDDSRLPYVLASLDRHEVDPRPSPLSATALRHEAHSVFQPLDRIEIVADRFALPSPQSQPLLPALLALTLLLLCLASLETKDVHEVIL